MPQLSSHLPMVPMELVSASQSLLTRLASIHIVQLTSIEASCYPRSTQPAQTPNVTRRSSPTCHQPQLTSKTHTTPPTASPTALSNIFSSPYANHPIPPIPLLTPSFSSPQASA